MTLAETQARFAALVVAPSAPSSAEVEFLRGTPELTALERLAVYAGMYQARLAEALRETFPAIARLLGDERFDALAEAYVAVHPSEHHDLGRLGRRLDGFLREHPDPEHPYLADLALLEWTRQEVFFAPPCAPAEPEALAGLGVDDFVDATLVISPALRVLRPTRDVTGPWRRAMGGEPPARPAAAPAAAPDADRAVAVWRSRFDVFHAAIPADEADALDAAAAGAPLSEVCASFLGRPDPPAAAHATLSGWLGEGWIAALERPPLRSPARRR